MRLETCRDKIREVAATYEATYGASSRYRDYQASERAEKARQLGLLDPETVMPELIDGIIGNRSWTHGFCSDCLEYVDRWVIVGEGGDDPATMCLECCKKALALLGDGGS